MLKWAGDSSSCHEETTGSARPIGASECCRSGVRCGEPAQQGREAGAAARYRPCGVRRKKYTNGEEDREEDEKQRQEGDEDHATSSRPAPPARFHQSPSRRREAITHTRLPWCREAIHSSFRLSALVGVGHGPTQRTEKGSWWLRRATWAASRRRACPSGS